MTTAATESTASERRRQRAGRTAAVRGLRLLPALGWLVPKPLLAAASEREPRSGRGSPPPADPGREPLDPTCPRMFADG